MEVEKTYFNNVESYIEKANKDENLELEIRFWSDNFQNIEVNEDKFKKVYEYFTFSKSNDGLGFASNMVSNLDVTVLSNSDNITSHLSKTRITIPEMDNIKKYWLNNSLNDIPYSIVEKSRIEKIDIHDYSIRVSLNEELPQKNILNKNKEQLMGNNGNNNKLNKYYRLKNRYEIKSDDGLFSIDLTAVKSGTGKTFREANVLKNIASYEIEIEYIGNKGNNKTSEKAENVTKKLFEYVHSILSILNETSVILKQQIKKNIIDSYTNLINVRNESIYGNPVTIHRRNLVKSKNVMNILDKYAVSLKADGLRMALFVYGSNKEEYNGNIYLIDINQNIIFTGYKDEKYVNSMIEGEYIHMSNGTGYEFYVYDMLYDKENDIRRRQYFNNYTEESVRSRSYYLDKFIQSNTRKPVGEYQIPIKRKNYKVVSTSGDGTDIFDKTKEIWNSRFNETFYVDGMIFTPMFEHYPKKGGSWYSLFKWKPEHLNTIDFLISVVKNDYGMEMKFPYIDNVIQGESKLKQYKKLRLYVSTLKDAFDSVTRKEIKRKEKTLFNPSNLDEEGASAYNTCYVFVDENDNIICEDPISGEKGTVQDDTIVEFGFDPKREKGFQWIPYRVRHDKTTSYKNGRQVYGNLDKTANDIFISLQYPVTEEMIITGKVPEDSSGIVNAPYYKGLNGTGENNSERFPYQNFHNYHIKSSLFKQVNPSLMVGTKAPLGKLLDLCCGKGVDVMKMKTAYYAEIVGMDIDYDNIKFAQQFYDMRIPRPKPKAFFIRGNAGELIFPNQDAAFTPAGKLQLKDFIPAKYYFDVVNVQFALHYFFENEIKLRTLIQNINDNLKIGGYFIGTCFDGQRVHQMLKGVNVVEGKTYSGDTLWKIQKKYSTTRIAFDRSKPNFGKQIDVLVHSIGNVHSEYLVNFEYLDAIMEEYGFEKVMIKPFSEYYEELLKSEYTTNNVEKSKDLEMAKKMSEEEKRFSFLNNAFIYKKIDNSSDKLFTSLVTKKRDAMKKEEKKKLANEDVEVLDEETGHLEIEVEKREEAKEENASFESDSDSDSELNESEENLQEENVEEEVKENEFVESVTENDEMEKMDNEMKGGKKMKRTNRKIRK